MYMATRHKHLKLDQGKIDRARRLLQAKTEQETIERALDLVLGEEAILRAHRRVKSVGGFDDVYRKSRPSLGIGTPRVLFDFPILQSRGGPRPYDLMPDGRFVIIHRDPADATRSATGEGLGA